MKTIAAIATPLATGGVAMIRLSGSDAIAIASRVFRPIGQKKLADMAGYTACYGGFYRQDEQIDDGVALVFHAPKSYTGEEVVELSCHGGLFSTREILRLLLEQGAVLAEAGEFSKRAFLNGKMTLTQAEAVIDLIQAQSNQALRAAKSQLDGALYQRISALKEELLTIAGHLAVWVDYPEEDIEPLETEALLTQLEQAVLVVSQLLSTFDAGKILREGVQTAIVGRPNVGKSTLMNLLSRCEKSIVTDIAGTTRDVVEETVQLGDVLLRLADTAGIRDTQDVVEQVGVQRALDRIQSAGLILAVFDSAKPLDETDLTIAKEVANQQVPAIAIWHKTDLAPVAKIEEIQPFFQHIVYTSKDNTDSLQDLERNIAEVLHLYDIDLSAGLLCNERQRGCAVVAKQALDDAVEALRFGMTLDAVTVLVETALQELLSLTGERVTDQVVDQVFHRFCVGK